jgi:hypothetical protein
VRACNSPSPWRMGADAASVQGKSPAGAPPSERAQKTSMRGVCAHAASTHERPVREGMRLRAEAQRSRAFLGPRLSTLCRGTESTVVLPPFATAVRGRQTGCSS